MQPHIDLRFVYFFLSTGGRCAVAGNTAVNVNGWLVVRLHRGQRGGGRKMKKEGGKVKGIEIDVKGASCSEI